MNNKYEERIKSELRDTFELAFNELKVLPEYQRRDSDSYIPVSQTATMGYDKDYLVKKGSPVSSEWLVATHVAVAYCTGYQKNIEHRELQTNGFNINYLAILLGFTDKRAFTQKEKIAQSLQVLQDKGILTLESLDGNELDLEDSSQIMIAKQSLTKTINKDTDEVVSKRTHFNFSGRAFSKLASADLTPKQKIDLIATYACIVTSYNMNASIEGFSFGQPENYTEMNEARKFVNLSGLEKMGQHLGVSAKTVSKRINSLVEMRLIFAVKVVHAVGYERHYYSRFEHLDILFAFFQSMSYASSSNIYEQLEGIRLAYNIDYNHSESPSESLNELGESIDTSSISNAPEPSESDVVDFREEDIVEDSKNGVEDVSKDSDGDVENELDNDVDNESNQESDSISDGEKWLRESGYVMDKNPFDEYFPQDDRLEDGEISTKIVQLDASKDSTLMSFDESDASEMELWANED